MRTDYKKLTSAGYLSHESDLCWYQMDWLMMHTLLSLSLGNDQHELSAPYWEKVCLLVSILTGIDFLSCGYEIQHGYTERGTILETEVCLYRPSQCAVCANCVCVCVSVASGLPPCYAWLRVGHSWYPHSSFFTFKHISHTSCCYRLNNKLPTRLFVFQKGLKELKNCDKVTQINKL